jgi:hypothetical protein
MRTKKSNWLGWIALIIELTEASLLAAAQQPKKPNIVLS